MPPPFAESQDPARRGQPPYSSSARVHFTASRNGSIGRTNKSARRSNPT